MAKLPPGAVIVGQDDEETQPASQRQRKDARTGGAAPAPTGKLPPGAEIVGAPGTSFGDRAKQAGLGAVEGFAASLPFAGAGLGAVTGGAVGGPAALATGTGGMVLGTAIGRSAEQAINDYTDIPSVEDIPPELRPSRYFGQVMGGAISPLGPVYAAGNLGFRTLADMRLFDRIVETAQRSPRSFAATEGAMAGYAGAGEYIAESVDPGDPVTRFTAGLAGGFVNPPRLLASSIEFGTGAARSVWASLSKAGQQSKAQTELARIFEENPGDPAKILTELETARLQMPELFPKDGPAPTVAMLSDDRTIRALENDLARREASFGRERKLIAEQSLGILRNSIDLLTQTGDPANLKVAAEMRQRYFDLLLNPTVTRMEEKVAELGRGLLGRSPNPEELATFSIRAAEIVNGALSGARAKERELYALVPDGAASGDNIIAMAEKIRTKDMATMAGEELESFTPVVTKALRALRDAAADRVEDTGLVDASGKAITRTVAGSETPTTVNELMRFRSLMLDEAREHAANNRPREARRAGELADAALADLNAVPGGTPELETAREFSRALNDTFTRSFAGAAVATNRAGGNRLPPELLVRRATATGQELGALRLQELRTAVEFGSPEAVKEMLDIQSNFLAHIATRVIDKETGLVTSTRRLDWVRERYAAVLEQMPELNEHLRSLESANKFFNAAQSKAQNALKVIENDAAFSRLLGNENPVRVVGGIMRGVGKNPESSFRQLAVNARRAGEPAVLGMQSAIMQDAVQSATRADGLDFALLERLLFEPRKAGMSSAVSLMQRNGLMTEGEVKRLRTLLDQASRISRALKGGGEIDELLKPGANQIVDFAARVGGAAVGAHAASLANSPSSIIAAGAGSRTAREVFDRIPLGKVQNIFVAAMKDAELFRILTKKTKNPEEQVELGLKLNAFLYPLAEQSLGDVTPEEAATGIGDFLTQ